MSLSLLNHVGHPDRGYRGGLHLPDFNYDAIKAEMSPILMCNTSHSELNGTVSRGYLLNNKR